MSVGAHLKLEVESHYKNQLQNSSFGYSYILLHTNEQSTSIISYELQ